MSPTDEQLDALDSALGEIDHAAARRGDSYLAQNRVGPLRWTPDGRSVVAVVRGSSNYSTTWVWHGDEWESTCTCPVGGWCKHAYAVGSAVLEEADGPAGDFEMDTFAPVPPPVDPRAEHESFLVTLEQAHGRKLKTVEKSVVKRLLGLYERFVRHGYVDGYAVGDFVRSCNPALGFGLKITSTTGADVFDPDHLPESLPDFWQHLAVVFRLKKWPIPDVLAPVTETTAIDSRIAARRRQREIDEWTQRLAQLVPPSSAVALRERRRLRVVVGPKALTFQAADLAGDDWSLVPFDELRSHGIAAELTDAAGKWDTTSVLLLGWFQASSHYGMFKPPQLRDPTTRQSLARALAHPDTRARVVNAAGQPYSWSSDELAWRFSEDPVHPGQVTMEFGRAGGGTLPQPLLYLGGPPHLYLSTAEVFAGPPPLGDRADVGWKIMLPAEVLAQERVLHALVQARAELPPSVAARIEHVPLRPLLRVDLAPTALKGERVRVLLTAVDAAGQRRLTYAPDGWTDNFEGAPRRPEGGRLFVPDTAGLEPALGQFQALDWDWDSHSRWTRDVHSQTPQELSTWFAGFPPDTIFELAPELAGLRTAPVRAEFALSIEESGRDWFDVELVVRSADTELTSSELELLHKAQGRWVRLEGKGWRRLALAVDAQQQARLAELGLAFEGVLPGKQRFHALQLAAADLEAVAAERAWAHVQARARAMAALPAPPPPAGLLAELRHYQQEGFHFLAHLSANSLGGILADDMGLGKTVQGLAWLLWLADHAPKDKPLRALVVCPKSVVTNWEREAARFTPALRVGVFQPKVRRGLPEQVEIVVANYAQLRASDSLFLAADWTAVILDEGQNIKNPQSQTAEVARKLRADHRLVLTGTPIENRVLDLWSLFAFAMPGLLGGQTQFKKLYDDRKDPTARTRLARRVRHFLLRRTKGQVATELPPRIEEDVICELEGDQKKLYDAELKRARQLVLGVQDQRGFDAQRFNILQSLLRLRQICCHPGLLGDEFARSSSAKVAALFDQLEPILAEGHKVLVFSQFVSVLEILQRELSAREIAYLTITGQTENRQELVDRFQTSRDVSVFLLSLKAAGSGLNLTAASYVVLFDPWWNPAVEAQAIDRTHRIGQTNQVIAYRLIAKDTVEEKIRLLQQEKAALARAVVQEESLASVMNLDDLRYVLG